MNAIDLQAVLSAQTSSGTDHLQAEPVGRLRAWGERVGLRARDAIHSGCRPPGPDHDHVAEAAAIARFFGADHPGHAFNCQPHHWLRLTEVQITRGIARFLNEGGLGRITAFLRALSPGTAWPTRFDHAWADDEVRTRSGRIDLLIRGQIGVETWAALVEAKVDHHSRDNPLADYRRAALSLGLSPMRAGGDGRVLLVILGRTATQATRKRLVRTGTGASSRGGLSCSGSSAAWRDFPTTTSSEGSGGRCGRG